MLKNCNHEYVDVTAEINQTTEASDYGGGSDSRYHYCCRKCLRQVNQETPLTEQVRQGKELRV